MQMSASSQQWRLVHGIRARCCQVATQCRIPLAERAASVAGVECELGERAATDVVGETLEQRRGLIAAPAPKPVIDLEARFHDLGIRLESIVLGGPVRGRVLCLVHLVVTEPPATRRGAVRSVLDGCDRGLRHGLRLRRLFLGDRCNGLLSRGLHRGYRRGSTLDNCEVGEIAEMESVPAGPRRLLSIGLDGRLCGCGSAWYGFFGACRRMTVQLRRRLGGGFGLGLQRRVSVGLGRGLRGLGARSAEEGERGARRLRLRRRGIRISGGLGGGLDRRIHGSLGLDFGGFRVIERSRRA